MEPSNPTLTPYRSGGTAPAAEQLGGAMQSLLAQSGYLTPERAAQIAGVQQRGREFERQQRTERLRNESGVFPRYASADLDDVAYVARVAPDVLGDYCHARDDVAQLMDRPTMLVLRGNNGPGKTHLASALVNRFCDLGRPARYTTAADFFLELKSTFNQPGRTQMDLIGRYRAYELLALDEIEVRSDSPWENNVLRSLIDARYAADLATLILTNKSEQELATYFSNAIRDRLREGGAVITCGWPSLRGRGAKR